MAGDCSYAPAWPYVGVQQYASPSHEGIDGNYAELAAVRYRLRTLLIVVALAGVASLGLRAPAALMAGIVSTFTLATVLFAVLMATYSTGPSRAWAMGYIVFCVGTLLHPIIADWTGETLEGELSPARSGII